MLYFDIYVCYMFNKITYLLTRKKLQRGRKITKHGTAVKYQKSAEMSVLFSYFYLSFTKDVVSFI